MFDLAKQSVAQHSGLKVIILTRLARYDLLDGDPKLIKTKLSEFGNNVFTTLWLKNGCPDNILICDQNLGCYGELKNKRYGEVKSSNYDGIHMRGPLGRQHYTNSVLRIFKEINPELQNKLFPKFPKPQQATTNTRPFSQTRNPHNNQGMRKPVPSNWRHFEDRRSNRRYSEPSKEHWDCPQTRHQFNNHAGFGNPGAGFTIPTQNRFNTFYNNQGNC
jgi:hypothetical protein